MPAKVVFILGSGRCGSTLLDLLLDSHSSIVGVGEMHLLRPDSFCACGNSLSKCQFWKSVIVDASRWQYGVTHRTSEDFIFNRDAYRSIRTRLLIDAGSYRDATVAAYKKALDHSGASVIVDSSKSPDRAELLAGSEQIEPFIIHLVRDGRAVTWSFMRIHWQFMPLSFAFAWAITNLKIEIMRRRFPGKYVLVRYENLADDPENELRRICSMLDLAYEPSMLNFRAGVHHQIDGNPMKFRKDEIHRDEIWRTKMPLKTRILFNLIFGWLNIYYMRFAR